MVEVRSLVRPSTTRQLLVNRMPDPTLILWVVAGSAALAAGVLLVVSWPWSTASPNRMAIGWILGVGAGFYLGAAVLGIMPRLTLAEDRDRFLLLVLPGVIVAELIAAFSSVPRWVGWLARAIVAAGAGPVLLRGSVYLEDLTGPGSRLWTAGDAAQCLGGLAVALLALWSLLGLLMHVAPARSVPLSLAVACAGSALAVMFSGSAIDGQLGFPLAAGLVGATAASFLLPAPPRGTAAIGVGVVGLFALLVGGRFFADLPLAPAAVLFAAPLLCWLTELPPRLRGIMRVLVVAILVGLVVFQAQQKFGEKSTSTSGEPTLEDYYRNLSK